MKHINQQKIAKSTITLLQLELKVQPLMVQTRKRKRSTMPKLEVSSSPSFLFSKHANYQSKKSWPAFESNSFPASLPIATITSYSYSPVCVVSNTRSWPQKKTKAKKKRIIRNSNQMKNGFFFFFFSLSYIRIIYLEYHRVKRPNL